MADKPSKMDEGYKDGLKAYKGREGSKVEEFVTKKITDPLDKLMSGDKDKEYVDGFKKAREEILGFKKGGKVKTKAMKNGGPTPFTSKTEAYKAGTYGSRTNSKPNPITPGPRRAMTKKFAKGGSVSSRADGCAQRGKTKGRMV